MIYHSQNTYIIRHRAEESWWAGAWEGSATAGMEKLILLKQMYQHILDQHAMAPGGGER